MARKKSGSIPKVKRTTTLDGEKMPSPQFAESFEDEYVPAPLPRLTEHDLHKLASLCADQDTLVPSHVGSIQIEPDGVFYFDAAGHMLNSMPFGLRNAIKALVGSSPVEEAWLEVHDLGRLNAMVASAMAARPTPTDDEE